MARSLLSILLFSFFLSFEAQNVYQKNYRINNSSFTNVVCLQPTNDGGYLFVGTDSVQTAQDRDIYVVKLDANADTVWAKSYGTTAFDYGQYGVQTYDGGYMIVGMTLTPSNSWDLYFLKLDAMGDTIWTRFYGGSGDDEANSVQQLPDSSYLVCGYTNSYGAGNYDYLLMRIDTIGNIIWSHTYGTLADELGYYGERTLDKGYIMFGPAYATNSTIDVYAVKTDSMGVVQWSKYYGTSFTEWGYFIRQLPDSGYIMSGYIESGAATDVLLIRTNSAGDTLWTKTYGGTDYEQGLCVTRTSDKGFAVAGSVSSGGFGSSDAMLLKTDSMGTMQFCHGFGGYQDDMSIGVLQTSDKGFAIGAYTNSLVGSYYNAYFVKTDSMGNANGNCNQITPTIQTIQRGIVPYAATTLVANAPFAPSFFVTNLDSGVIQSVPCISLSVPVTGNSGELLIYPNPTNGNFILSAHAISSPLAVISVVNTLGELVYRCSVKNHSGAIEHTMSPVLASGTYFIRLQDGNECRMKKLIVTE